MPTRALSTNRLVWCGYDLDQIRIYRSPIFLLPYSILWLVMASWVAVVVVVVVVVTRVDLAREGRELYRGGGRGGVE